MKCNQQILTATGDEYVCMGSGVTVKLHKCSRPRGHDGACGWMGWDK